MAETVGEVTSARSFRRDGDGHRLYESMHMVTADSAEDAERCEGLPKLGDPWALNGTDHDARCRSITAAPVGTTPDGPEAYLVRCLYRTRSHHIGTISPPGN